METGCYLLEFTPTAGSTNDQWPSMAGTLRIEAFAGSADLYLPDNPFVPPDDPIPIWPRSAHVCSFSHTRPPLKGATDLNAQIELRRRDTGERIQLVLSAGELQGQWTGELRKQLGSPNSGNFQGLGTVTATWISDHARTARILLHQQQGATTPAPASVSIETAWDPSKIFGLRWRVLLQEDVPLAGADLPTTWSAARLHEVLASLTQHDNAVYDREWRYRILRIRSLQSVQGYTVLGLMFDSSATDSSDVPREAAAVAMDGQLPGSAGSGSSGGSLANNPVLLRRTTLHELGHIMGLSHRTEPTTMGRQRIMATTQDLRNSMVHGSTLESAARAEFHSSDLDLLNHRPDPEIRPGGNPFAQGGSFLGDSFVKARMGTNKRVRLKVEPILESFPLGSPVRLHLSLRNGSRKGIQAPARLRLLTGELSGTVMRSGPGKRPSVRRRKSLRHPFHSIVVPEIAEWQQPLAPWGAEIRTGSISLLRGHRGSLFSQPGTYTIAMEVLCTQGNRPIRVTAHCTVYIAPPLDSAAATAVLAEPQTHLLLEIGGAHLQRGIEALQRGTLDPSLRPHWLFTEARWRALARVPDFRKSAEILAEPSMILHAGDIEEGLDLLKLIQPALGASNPLVQHAARALIRRAQSLQSLLLPTVLPGLTRIAEGIPERTDKPSGDSPIREHPATHQTGETSP